MQNRYRLYTGITCSTMIILAFIALFIAYTHPSGNAYTWFFWAALFPCFFVINLIYCYYLQYTNQDNPSVAMHYNYTLWLVALVAWLVILLAMHEGLMNHFAGGLVTLLLLSIAVFTQGITLNKIFLLTGVILFSFVLCLTVLSTSLAISTFTILILGLLVTWVIINHQQK